jgi:hypothetical protein
MRTALIFGTERKPLSPVTEAEWKRFADGEIALRFVSAAVEFANGRALITGPCSSGR